MDLFVRSLLRRYVLILHVELGKLKGIWCLFKFENDAARGISQRGGSPLIKAMRVENVIKTQNNVTTLALSY
jgi:hypothetical protein